MVITKFIYRYSWIPTRNIINFKLQISTIVYKFFKFMKRKIIYILLMFILLISIVLTVAKISEVGNIPKYQKKIWAKAFIAFMDMPDFLKSSVMILSGRRNFSNLFNDYNVKFLPQTQYINLDFVKKKINFEKDTRYTFYIDNNNENLFLTTKKGKFFKTNLSNIINTEKKLKINEYNSFNLSTKEEENVKILDTLVIDNKLFISKVSKINNCERLEIKFSELKEVLNFQSLIKFKECASIKIGAGRIHQYNFDKQKGILITTNDSDNDFPGVNAQNDNSIFGKILFINLKNKSFQIFSKGHRNPQGLATYEDTIISTEHGPRGGDEINKILYKKNYGWPIASYGNSYKKKSLNYKKNHKDNDFQEPLFVFLPSIGISELIFLPKEFDENWQNNILVSSLNGRSLHRIRFSDLNYEKVLYDEKIYIGERIRDIKYIKKYNLIILALERTGSLGILKKN